MWVPFMPAKPALECASSSYRLPPLIHTAIAPELEPRRPMPSLSPGDSPARRENLKPPPHSRVIPHLFLAPSHRDIIDVHKCFLDASFNPLHSPVIFEFSLDLKNLFEN